MITAHTYEIDFPDDALREILEQVNVGNGLMKNSVGLLHCRYEFIKSGLVELLCAKLPFDVVGCTTNVCATMGKYSADMISLSVFTSDDAEFSIALSEPLSAGDVRSRLGEAYRIAADGLSGKPALAIVQMPMSLEIGASDMLSGITSAGGDVPVFGVAACDETSDYHESRVIYKGSGFEDSVVLLLMGGDVHPRFFIENVSHIENMQEQYGIVTESDGCLLKSVNDMLFLDYIASIGLSPEVIKNMKVFPIPFKIDYNDGTKSLLRILLSVTPEGYAIFSGEMPAGTSVAMQRLNYAGVMETAKDMANTLTGLRDASGVLMYSCIGRNFLLGMNLMDELREISNAVCDKMPYHICYGGGEICPLEDDAGKLVARSHNYTLIACVF
jgi:hypothetical protein